MSKREKLVQRIRQNPKNVSFEDLDKLMSACGYTRSQPGGGSSHLVYRKPGQTPLTIPKHKPVKEVYVKKVLAILDEQEDPSGDGDDQ